MRRWRQRTRPAPVRIITPAPAKRPTGAPGPLSLASAKATGRVVEELTWVGMVVDGAGIEVVEDGRVVVGSGATVVETGTVVVGGTDVVGATVVVVVACVVVVVVDVVDVVEDVVEGWVGGGALPPRATSTSTGNDPTT